MSQSYEKTVREHLRITLLRLLNEQPDCTLNESLLTDLSGGYGFAASRDRVRTELSWLREQGLVVVEDMCGLMVATLTSRGEDVACARTTVPGVKRPRPNHG
jgi:DNA-binding GntR family transcriptional regulator